MKTTFFLTILMTLMPAISGCSMAGSNKSESATSDLINVPTIPAATVVNTPLNVAFKPYVLLDQVKDQRQFPELIRLYGSPLKPRGTIDVITRYAFRATFRQRGFTVTDSAPVTIIPTIKKWLVTVDNNQGVAETVLAIDVVDPGNQVIYSSSYDGFIQFLPSSNREELRKILGDSFAKALSQMIADEQLLEILVAF